LSKLFLITQYIESVSDSQWQDGSVHTYIQGAVASKLCYFIELVKSYTQDAETISQNYWDKCIYIPGFYENVEWIYWKFSEF